MKKTKIFTCYLLFTTLFLQAQGWQWAKTTSDYENTAYSVTTDKSGNVYVAGNSFNDGMTFNSVFYPKKGFKDIFLAKYDSNGNLLWGKYIGGDFFDYVAYNTSVATDALGNVYLAGTYLSANIKFGNITLNNSGASNVFLAKYDTNGNVIWIKQSDGDSHNVAHSVAVDIAGNILLAGAMRGVTTFGSITLNSVGEYDVFLIKYDTNGNALWAKSAGSDLDDEACAVTTDASGNIFLSGVFSSAAINFDSTVLKNKWSGRFDLFIAKYNPDGDILWAKSEGGNQMEYATSLGADSEGNVIMCGYFNSDSLSFGGFDLYNPLVYDPSKDIYYRYYDIYIAKYDTNGNALWAKSAGESDNDYARSVSVDALGNIWLAGYFRSATIKFGSYTLNNNYPGWDDIFIAKYDRNGSEIWATSVGGSGFGSKNDFAFGITSDTSGNTYVAGSTQSDIISFGSTTFNNDGYAENFFIAKISSETTGTSQLIRKNELSVYPNPTQRTFTVNYHTSQIERLTVTLCNALGEIIFSESINNFNGEYNKQIDVSGCAKGIYFLEILTEDKMVSRKLIVQ